MNIDTRILGYVWNSAVVCLDCVDQELVEAEVGDGNASVINVYNSEGFAPDGCSCDFCHEWVIEPTEDLEDVFVDFLGGLA